MRSEFSANKALYDTFQVAKKMAQAFNKKGEAKLADCSSLNDMNSMKEFQAKNKAFGKAMFLVD